MPSAVSARWHRSHTPVRTLFDARLVAMDTHRLLPRYSRISPIVVGPDDASTCLVSIGTVPTKLAWDCQTAAPSFAGAPVVVVSVLNHAVDAPFWAGIFAKYKTLVVIEDDIGASRSGAC